MRIKIYLLLLLYAFNAGAQGLTPLLQKYKAAGLLLSFYDFRSGTLLNLEGTTARDGVGANVVLDKSGVKNKYGVASSVVVTPYLFNGMAFTYIVKYNLKSYTANPAVGAGRILDGVIYPKFYVYTAGGNAQFDVSATGNNGFVLGYGVDNVTAVVYSASSILNLYNNGIKVGTNNKNVGALTAGTTVKFVGHSTYVMNGNIQWVLIFNTALTLSEINAITAEVEAIQWPTLRSLRAPADVALALPAAMQYKTDWGTPVTISNKTAGELLPGWRIISGTWAIVTSTHKGRTTKAIKNIVAGTLAFNPASLGQMNSTEAAYGTWKFTILKGADANVLDVMIVADTEGGASAAGQDGYGVRFDSDETIAFVESVAGTPTDIITTTAKSLNTLYEIGVSRMVADLWTLQVDGVTIGTATDATKTTAEYVAIDADANDMIIISDVTGNYGYSKQLGAIF